MPVEAKIIPDQPVPPADEPKDEWLAAQDKFPFDDQMLN